MSVEVDGRPWRVVADDVVVRAGLRTGLVLRLAVLRPLVAELRRSEASALAGRALARRELSKRRLRERLERARVRPPAVDEVVSGLVAAGLVDDTRLAERRADSLAARGWGDAAIAARLESEGIGEDLARAAIAGLAPESERAHSLASRAPDPRRLARLLARRGFSAETIEEAVAGLDLGAEPGLRYG